MATRRAFLGWASFVGVGFLAVRPVAAHHKPGHHHGPAPTTTTLAPPSGSAFLAVFPSTF